MLVTYKGVVSSRQCNCMVELYCDVYCQLLGAVVGELVRIPTQSLIFHSPSQDHSQSPWVCWMVGGAQGDLDKDTGETRGAIHVNTVVANLLALNTWFGGDNSQGFHQFRSPAVASTSAIIKRLRSPGDRLQD